LTEILAVVALAVLMETAVLAVLVEAHMVM
jgi:hypothetical protein